MSRLSAVAGLAATLAVAFSSRGECAAPKKLTREEMVALFSGLSEASKTARTFQGKLRRTEESGFVMDEEPLVSEGRVLVERPDRYRQEITSPRRSLIIANERDLWVYFPEAREVQHIDLTKGIRGRADTTSESFMPWLTFDLAGLEKRYALSARRAKPPEGVTIYKVPPGRGGGIVQGLGTEVKAGDFGVRPWPGRPPAECFKIEFVPLKPEFAPRIARLLLWVDGGNPWPLKIEQETPDGDVLISVFTDIVLDATLEAGSFEFRPPRGTKVVELSD